jgi:hypothetical protein
MKRNNHKKELTDHKDERTKHKQCKKRFWVYHQAGHSVQVHPPIFTRHTGFQDLSLTKIF